MKLALIIFGVCSIFGTCRRLKGNKDKSLNINIMREPVQSQQLGNPSGEAKANAMPKTGDVTPKGKAADLEEFGISPTTDAGSEMGSLADDGEDDDWEDLSQERLVLVSNRVPIPDEHGVMPAGGLTTALEMAVGNMASTLWVGAHSEVSDEKKWLPKPMQVKQVLLLPWILSETGQEGFYEKFSNSFLWPLCHSLSDHIHYDSGSLKTYRNVATSFAKRLILFLKEGDLLWIHDYHMIPLASALRYAAREQPQKLLDLAQSIAGFFRTGKVKVPIPALRKADENDGKGTSRLHLVNLDTIPIGFFFHIPVPPLDLWKSHGPFRSEQSRLEFCSNFADYNLIGVHTQMDLKNMVAILGECEHGKVRVEVHPIGINPEEIRDLATDPKTIEKAKKMLERWYDGDKILILGVDRLDYTKGIPQRIRAVMSFFNNLKDQGSKLLDKLFFLQIASPSRENVDAYGTLRKEVEILAGKAKELKLPMHIHLQKEDRKILSAMYRMASVGLVTPLKDGMNLVAKEYVAAQNPKNPGVLILSAEAGAAHGSMKEGALVVNPTEAAIGEKLPEAVSMDQGIRIQRWQIMQQDVFTTTSQSWSDKFLTSLRSSLPKE